MLLSCFRNPTADHRRLSLITCTYQTTLLNTPTLLTLTWSKTPTSHTLTLHSPDLFTSTISLSSPPFSLFRARPSSKSIGEIKVYWDFARAEFDRVDSAEPGSCFYLALARAGRVEFFLGDRIEELTRRVGSGVGSAESTQVSRREHVFGRRRYAATARFAESRHEVEIECARGTMKVRIDGRTGLVVKRLGWKFRGSERILIGGLEVDFSWDVFDWVSAGDGDGDDDRKRSGSGGHGVFVFQVGGGGGALPEMVGPEKKLMGKRSAPATAGGVVSPAPSWSSSVSQWAEESGDCGRSSGLGSNSNSSGSWGGGGGGGSGGGFSLVLYAWRRE